MVKNVDVSDSNNILKTIIIILIVVGIAYVVYYLYNKNQEQNMMNDSESQSMMLNNASMQSTGEMQMNNIPNMENNMRSEENINPSINNVNTQMNNQISGQQNPIMNKTEYLPKGKIVGEDAIEHFSADENYKVERNLTSFPKDQLTAEELLPQNNSSLWAQVNPSGEGSLKDRNFLQSGYHIGINTVGQTLRNANLQLRSEPPCPQVRVSPWIQSTIEPDVSRKPFEIGGCQ